MAAAIPLTGGAESSTAEAFPPLSFDEARSRAQELADYIETHGQELRGILTQYETEEVAADETARALDLLRNLHENREHFELQVGCVATFLPRNQPLYALTSFVLVPALMAREVQFRIPHTMRDFLPRLLAFLDMPQRFPEVLVAAQGRAEFIRERAALLVDPASGASVPATDVVIFTGTPDHAAQLRAVFDPRTLFITNGSGHNPIVVAPDADVGAAVDAVLTLALYNQGQDCAAPNAILVHEDVADAFIVKLRRKLKAVRVGAYSDPAVRVGPLSDASDLPRILEFLVENSAWIDRTTPGAIRAAGRIVEPTLIVKPLVEGGNYTELFAPVVVVQPYASDDELALYFENPRYARNAMYVTVYGSSDRVESLVLPEPGRPRLHDASTLLRNTHLHATGVERGTKPYGGYGPGASSVSFDGVTTPKPTLPQRDLHRWAVARAQDAAWPKDMRGVELRQKHVPSKARSPVATPVDRANRKEAYVDLLRFSGSRRRFAKLSGGAVHALLVTPHLDYMATLAEADRACLCDIRALLERREDLSFERFKRAFGALVLGEIASEASNPGRDRIHHHLYRLLFGAPTGPALVDFLWDADAVAMAKLLPR